MLCLPRKVTLMIDPRHIWTSFTMRRVTGLILQRHQILHLPRKMTLVIDVRHIWDVIYNARSNRTHPPTSPNIAPATLNDSHDWCPSHMRRHLQCTEQQDSSSNVTKYCTSHVKWLSWLMSVTYATSVTMRGPTGAIHQRHQVLLLPRKMTRIIDPRDIWNVIYNCAEQQVSYTNVTKYCACHVKWLSWLMPVTYERSFTMRGATGITLQPHQILRLPRKIAFQNLSEICRKQLNNIYLADDSTMIRTWSDHEIAKLNPSVRRAYFYPSAMHFVLKITTSRAPAIYPDFTEYCDCACHKSDAKITKYCACHEKWHSKITKCCACHEKWRSKITKYCPCHEKWIETLLNCYFTELLLYRRRHFQCAEQQDSSSNGTKYCTCHVKWLSWLVSVTYEASFTTRGATGLIFQCHQILHLPRKMTLVIDVRHIWDVIYNARSNRTHPPTSPNIAPATLNDSHDWCPSHMKRHLQRAEQQDSSSNVTKYCTSHVKWLSWLMSVAYETSFTMHGATGLIFQCHQILHLPRKMTLMIDVRHICNVSYNARTNRCHTPTSPSTAPAT